MLRKLPLVIAIELVIGVLAFLFAGEKVQFGALFLIFSFAALLIVAAVYAFKSLEPTK